VVVCLERDADLHMATATHCLLLHIGSTFLVLAHPGSPGQRAIKLVCACVSVCTMAADVLCSTFGPSAMQLCSRRVFTSTPADHRCHPADHRYHADNHRYTRAPVDDRR